MKIEIETETWPESVGWPEPGPASTPSPAGGRWRLIHVVLSAHDADTEQVMKEGRQDA
jgi:hypothetical protein